ncbi:MAG: ABC transporter permease [Egibacteraceae bacterium]
MTRRLARLVLLVAGVAVLAFVLVEMSPVDPVNAYVGAEVTRIGPEQRELIAERFGLNDPPLVRFGLWAGRILRGDLGTSMIYNAPVADVIATRFRASLVLLGTAWVLSGVLGFTLGLLAAITRGSFVDRSIRWFAYTLTAAPTFWIGLLLLTTFSVLLGWTPVCCATPIGIAPADATLWQRLHHLILPAAMLSVVGVAPIVLHTREQAVGILRSDFVTFARAQGERGGGLVRYRLLRNAVVPAVLLQFASLSELFGGSILAEQVFSYPGLGQATAAAGLRGDVPLLLGIVLFSAIFVFAGNTLGDIVHGLVDPRVVPLRARRAT